MSSDLTTTCYEYRILDEAPAADLTVAKYIGSMRRPSLDLAIQEQSEISKDSITSNYKKAGKDGYQEHVASLVAIHKLVTGDEAEPPNEVAIAAAARMLRYLEHYDCNPSRIVPSAEGGVGICFFVGNYYADIECFNSGEVLAVTSDRRNAPEVWRVSETPMGAVETINRLRTHFVNA